MKLLNTNGDELFSAEGSFKEVLVLAVVADTNLENLMAYGQDLSGVALDDMIAPGGNFYGCNFAGATGLNANMKGALCYGARFGDHSDWAGADFDGANMTGATWTD